MMALRLITYINNLTIVTQTNKIARWFLKKMIICKIMKAFLLWRLFLYLSSVIANIVKTDTGTCVRWIRISEPAWCRKMYVYIYLCLQYIVIFVWIGLHFENQPGNLMWEHVFRSARTSWITFVSPSVRPFARPSARKIWISCISL